MEDKKYEFLEINKSDLIISKMDDYRRMIRKLEDEGNEFTADDVAYQAMQILQQFKKENGLQDEILDMWLKFEGFSAKNTHEPLRLATIYEIV